MSAVLTKYSNEWFEALHKQQERDGEIHCPWCDHIFQDEESDYISYQSEYHPGEVECEGCEQPFLVQEIVVRKYETTKAEVNDVA